MSAKGEAEKVLLQLRLPRDIKTWVEQQAAHNCSSLNSEIIRSLREKMDGRQPERVSG